MKKGFTLLEMIFAIVIISVLASFALPKLFSTTGDAKVSVVKQDIQSIINSVQSYVLVNGQISKITDAINLNSSIWDTTNDLEVKFIDGNSTCISIKVQSNKLELDIDSTNAGTVCTKLKDGGIVDLNYDLN